MSAFKGNAAFTWTDSGSPRTYLLNRPLDRVQYAMAQTSYPGTSLDLSQYQVFTVGTGAYELVAQIRYDDDPQGLLDLLKFGQQGGTITYWPDLDNDQESYACNLIEPMNVTLELESSYPATGSLVTLRLRQTNEGRFA